MRFDRRSTRAERPSSASRRWSAGPFMPGMWTSSTWCRGYRKIKLFRHYDILLVVDRGDYAISASDLN